MASMGQLSKKVIVYESDKRYADFRIMLANDGISQAGFLRAMIQGYIKQDKDLMPYIDKIKNKQIETPKAWTRESRRKRKLAQQKIDDLGLNEEEIDNIFDILEQENPGF
jgi:hypothetical protein